jgi:hypothetical protein
MKLHEAIEKVLIEKGKPMTTIEIADELNNNKYYTKKDNSLITPYQIHGRTKNFIQIFNRDSTTVSLINKSI